MSPAHSGIDFPTERLFRAHTDDFYAVRPLKDPTIEPEEIFTTAADYQTIRTLYLTPPAQGEARRGGYDRTIALIGLSHPTYQFVSAYWAEQIYNSIILDSDLISLGFAATEIAGLRATYGPRLAAAVQSFKDAGSYNGDMEAFEAYAQAYDQWHANR